MGLLRRLRPSCGWGRIASPLAPGRAPEPATLPASESPRPLCVGRGQESSPGLVLPLIVSRASHIPWRRPAGASRRTRRPRPARDDRGAWNFLPAGKGDARPECRPGETAACGWLFLPRRALRPLPLCTSECDLASILRPLYQEQPKRREARRGAEGGGALPHRLPPAPQPGRRPQALSLSRLTGILRSASYSRNSHSAEAPRRTGRPRLQAEWRPRRVRS